MIAVRHHLRRLLRVLRAPDELLHERLYDSRPLIQVLGKWMVAPLCIRPAAVLFRSIIVDAQTTAVVLATGSLALQIGVWLAASALLPTLAHQFRAPLREHDALLLCGFASMPLWLSGALFVIPSAFSFMFWWSRLLSLFFGLYGVFIFYRGLHVLGLRREVRLPIVVSFTTIYLVIYAVLFALLGLSSHVILWVLGA